ncbi:hypothetical protein AYI68_g3034 [Smittium mucronatum]|uniref:Uncharacterized protein n=1 Tax=Smittium mucronatum TaxID=133383 RepID=A0A1R0H128_9FUNG|nr:hypothetical protein AYI68_g3034 [Smittium mucronatum]
MDSLYFKKHPQRKYIGDRRVKRDRTYCFEDELVLEKDVELDVDLLEDELLILELDKVPLDLGVEEEAL